MIKINNKYQKLEKFKPELPYAEDFNENNFNFSYTDTIDLNHDLLQIKTINSDVWKLMVPKSFVPSEIC